MSVFLQPLWISSVVLILLNLHLASGQSQSSSEKQKRKPAYVAEKEILDSLLVKYQKSVRPYPADGGPTVAVIGLFVGSISSINEVSMDFSVDFSISESWRDPRLSFNNSGYEQELRFLKPNQEFIRNIWVPDIYFPTERRGSHHDITQPNRMLRIYPSGDVLFEERFTLVFACHMNLVKYPFDVQMCPVQIGSLLILVLDSYTTDSLLLEWLAVPIDLEPALTLPKFKLAGMETLPCVHLKQRTGNFTCLKFQLTLTRQIGYHIVEAYLPSMLLVIASWLGFWIDASSVPGRVALSVTTMLTTVAQSTNVKNSLPPVSYIKAIDIWLGVCIFFVFSALVEFALVNFLSRREVRQAKAGLAKTPVGSPSRQMDNSHAESASLLASPCCGTIGARHRKQKDSSLEYIATDELLEKGPMKSSIGERRIRSKCVDRTSRFLFPILFFSFVIIYAYIFAT